MPLDDPIRLHIQKQLSYALAEISTADGYATDLQEANIHRGRTVFGQKDALPMLSILEVPIPQDQAPVPMAAPIAKGTWELMIQGFVQDDKDNPTDPAHVIMADVKKRLAIERAKVDYDGGPENGIFGQGRVVTDIRIGPGVVRPPDEISAKAYFWLTIELDLVEDLTDPYGSNA